MVKRTDKYTQAREDKLKNSLPYLDTSEESVFPKMVVKPKHTLIYGIFWCVFIAIFIAFQMLFAVIRVDGHSMDPTLQSGHFVLASRHDKPKRFDIVILKERIDDDVATKTIIKRVIGLPGDVVTVIDGVLYVNNKKYNEAYLEAANIKNFKNVDWTITIPKDKIFVLGDNRDVSKDSRLVGSFDVSSIVGIKVLGGKD